MKLLALLLLCSLLVLGCVSEDSQLKDFSYSAPAASPGGSVVTPMGISENPPAPPADKPAAPSPSTMPADEGVSIILDKEYYEIGDVVRLEIKNGGTASVKYEECDGIPIALFDEQGFQYRLVQDPSCVSKELGAGKTRESVFSLNYFNGTGWQYILPRHRYEVRFGDHHSAYFKIAYGVVKRLYPGNKLAGMGGKDATLVSINSGLSAGHFRITDSNTGKFVDEFDFSPIQLPFSYERIPNYFFDVFKIYDDGSALVVANG